MPELLPLRLAARRPGRVRPQLETLQAVLGELGDPQRGLRSILVVGTNGKGSTAAMLEAMLSSHGLVTGLYTSPHLVRVEERVRIGGRPLDTTELERHLAPLDSYPELTFFETLTAAALLAFADAGVECAVLEAGMGGRWDATRAAASEIAGLTNVGSDHAGWLGSSLAERARDKGEALAAARSAVIGPQLDPDLLPEVGAPRARAAAELVRLEWLAGGRVRAGWEGGAVELPLPLEGDHQFFNLHLALALARCAAEIGWIESLEAGRVVRALQRLSWPGRLSTHRVFGRRVLVDCAHNAEGARALADHLAEQPMLYHLLFSCLEDKPVEEMARVLRPHVGNVAICPLEDERTASIERLQEAFPEARCASSVGEACQMLPAPVLAAGSVRLVGELLSHTDRGEAA
jgi:dihydrofolate synthase/folylpolyglutamate synthase